ncbi:putative tetratricopeptide repeat protein 41 [Polypterus senegalus]|uniref:putative tetratricopeptide repeat protein 41 n=1 Tax=Polypterus senegalus TaxID=55291 RepID=UPI001965149B|nr:putative tetratricopeptide repeat protein 41 [Polypterus senegalus]XP_039617742.1 putative tetratricopeptide repeat protein 41 [Polypterus senegalus]
MKDLDCHRGISWTPHLCPPIQPFFCSVPNDILQEKNYLMTETFPQLNAFCRSRGTYFRAIHLQEHAHDIQSTVSQQTANFSQQKNFSSQRLKISLDYINNCSPFFICVLGSQYGDFCTDFPEPLETSTSNEEVLPLVKRNLYMAAATGYPWVLSEKNRNCSLTELEIIQAAFINNSHSSFFYFKDYCHSEDVTEAIYDSKHTTLKQFTHLTESEQLKVRELKCKIINKGLPVRFYKSLKHLGELVFEDWKGIVEKLHSENLLYTSPSYEDSLIQVLSKAFTKRCSKSFVSSPESQLVFEKLDAFVLSSSEACDTEENSLQPQMKSAQKSILLLYGAKGCGKSSLLANWLEMFTQNHQEMLVLSHYVGTSSPASDIQLFLRYCTRKLRCKHFGIEEADALYSENQLDLWTFPQVVQAFVSAAGLRPCLLVLDGINELGATFGLSEKQVKEFQWMPVLPPNCKCVLSTTFSDLSYKSIIHRQDVQVLHCTCPSDTVRGRILQKHQALPEKEIPSTLLWNIMHKKLSKLPAVLAVLGRELRTCGVFSDEEVCMEEYLEVHSLHELWGLVLKRWVQDYSWTAEKKRSKKKRESSSHSEGMKGWVPDVLCLIRLSHGGLSEDELLSLLRILGYSGPLEVPNLAWASFRCSVWEWIQEQPDGMINFNHLSISQAVDHFILNSFLPLNDESSSITHAPKSRKKTLHRHLAQFFRHHHSLERVYMEYPWHLERCANWDELHIFVSNLEIVDFVARNTEHWQQCKMDFLLYWKALLDHGYDIFISFQKIVKEIIAGAYGIVQDISHVAIKDDDPERLITFAIETVDILGNPGQAENLLLMAESLLSTGGIQDRRTMEGLLRVWKYLVDLYYREGNLQMSKRYCYKALAITESLIKMSEERIDDIQRVKGEVLRKMGEIAVKENSVNVHEILEEISRNPSICIHPCGEATEKLICGFHNFSFRNFSAAESYLNEALTLRKCWYGQDHPLVADIEECLADQFLYSKTDFSSSRRLLLELYNHVVNVKEHEMRHTSSPQAASFLGCSIATSLIKLGKVLRHNGRLQEKREAKEHLQRAVDLRVGLLGPDHRMTREALLFLKNACDKLGNDIKLLNLRRNSLPSSENNTAYNSLHYNPESRDMKTPSFSVVASSLECPVSRPASSTIHSEKCSTFRPLTTCLTTISGPFSSITNLMPSVTPDLLDRHKVIHKSAWYHVPGRYPTLQQMFPPKRHQVRINAWINTKL